MFDFVEKQTKAQCFLSVDKLTAFIPAVVRVSVFTGLNPVELERTGSDPHGSETRIRHMRRDHSSNSS